MPNIPYVDLAVQHVEIKKEIMDAVEGVIDRADFILGEQVESLEKAVAAYCGTKYAVGVNSGTDALFLSLKAYGIGAGDEVITAPNSFLSTASVIVAAGAKPVFVDVRDDLNIDPSLIEGAITKRTKAIMPVHLTGRVADMSLIMKIAKKHKLRVIEDAAQAIGSEYRSKRAGSFGDAGCLSFHPLKTLNACGDGGAIVTDDEKLYLTLIQLRNIGLKNRNESDIWGYNSRLDTMQAAILNVKMKYLDKWIDARIKNALYYVDKLSKVCLVPNVLEGEKQTFHTFVIQVEDRDKLKEYLEWKGIGTRVHYPIPIHMQKASRMFGYKKGDFPVCERQAERILSLPVYHGMKKQDLAYIVDKVESYYKSK